MIISAEKFKGHVTRGKWHTKSKRLSTVISSLEAYHLNKSDINLRTLHTDVNKWAKDDPKEFQSTNFNSNNAVYTFFAEVNAQFYVRKLGPFQGVSQPKSLVFIPFGGVSVKEFKLKTEQWNEAEKENISGGMDKDDVRSYDMVLWEKSKVNKSLQEFPNENAEIFIRGHGSPGATHISTRNKINENEASVVDAVSVTEVCDRLIESGLKTSYKGNIHFYSCHSGVDILPLKLKNTQAKQKQKLDNNQKVKKEHLVSNKCIARLGADYLRSKGYVQARYFGYLGPLVAEYSKPEHDPNDHKTPVIKTEIDDYMHRYVQISTQGFNIISNKRLAYSSDQVAIKYRARVGKREV